MAIITLGPDEDGATYTLNGRTGLLIMKGETTQSYMRTERGQGDSYFTPALTERPKRASKIREEWGDDEDTSRPFDRIMITKTKCEKRIIGCQPTHYTKYKVYLFYDDESSQCFVRKFVIES